MRECECLKHLTVANVSETDLAAEKNERIIQSIAHAPYKKISYFAEEFEISDLTGEKREYIYPYLGDVIDLMLKEARYYEVEILLQAARHHNQMVYWRLKEMLTDNGGTLSFSQNQDVVCFRNRFSTKEETFISNLIQVKGESKAYNLKSIYEEVNDWRERVIQLGAGIYEDDF